MKTTTDPRLLGTGIYQGPVPRTPSDYGVVAKKMDEPIAVFKSWKEAWDFATLGELIKCEYTQTFQMKAGPSCWDDNGNLRTRP